MTTFDLENEIKNIKREIDELKTELQDETKNNSRIRRIILGDPDLLQYPGLAQRFAKVEVEINTVLRSNEFMSDKIDELYEMESKVNELVLNDQNTRLLIKWGVGLILGLVSTFGLSNLIQFLIGFAGP